ncbi:jerky protein homolog-like [Latimeria chalumnae]|uniref:jerky protein homolog-like n=1 Tax=Latimeria chalumnae TaxID=7897 RepID=UPI0006D91FEC|nr:PREDICTED: jerky protein homolog-like [Latimeria chalumnae]|eukprot:XP_006014171.2 PREDICTED: jerky protein homolog-like [Latimeria chalumnae]
MRLWIRQWMWFVQNRLKGTPISGPILKEKAKHFHRDLNSEEEGFNASDGWLNWFKNRHGIHQLSITGEIMNTHNESIASFHSRLLEIMETEVLTDQQIYNTEETGSFWGLLPDKALASSEEHCASGFKKNKEHLTILACTNATGEHKLPLLVTGKSANPLYFKHVNLVSLPVLYRAQRSAWMNSEIFCAWFVENFIPDVCSFLRSKGLPIRALLLIDNAGAHPRAESLKNADGSIWCEFLPANTTAKLQPMDQGVLATLKRTYRGKLLSYVLNKENDKLTLSDIIMSLSIKDATYMLAKSWKDIQTSTIKKCWAKYTLLQPPENVPNQTPGVPEAPDQEQEAISNLYAVAEQFSFNAQEVENWVQTDKADEEYSNLSDSEIVQSVLQQNHTEVCEIGTEQTQVDPDDVTIPTDAEAANCLEKAIIWLENQTDADGLQIILLWQLWQKAVQKRNTHK